MQRHVIIVAGGKGLRMGADIPKQFLPIQGKPLLMHTLETFHSFDAALSLTLVLPPAQQDYWRQLCREHDFHIPHQIADGGETRFQSVSNGLAALSEATDDALVAVHDGARPLITAEGIRRCAEAARETGAAACAHPVVDTLKRADEHDCTLPEVVSRERLWGMETPQIFRLPLLREAYKLVKARGLAVTDEVSAVEAAGVQTHLVQVGANMKITLPGDLELAELIWKHRA